jgi:N utilization substance protein B
VSDPDDMITELASSEPVSGQGSRHRAREVALQVLYAVDLAKGEDATRLELLDPIFMRIVENFEVPPAVEKFAKQLVVGVTEHIESLDEILGVHARNWRVSRMAAVDRNVLRLAVYELRHSEIPVAVVIDEAVDLARRFGADASPAFVNGVLDAVAREVRAT